MGLTLDQLLAMRAFFDLYLKGIPHDLPDDGTRPLTHLSGVVAASARGPATQATGPGQSTAQPPRDIAQ
jgi:hypothetical protein